MNKLKALQNKIDVEFENINLLKEALTHRSYPNENNSWPYRNNERLEFLGDAVLELTVTDYLFSNFAGKEEGELTIYRAAIVNTKSLFSTAGEMGLDEEILMSRGEKKDFAGKARESISANAVEALIGAVYLDQGYKAARDFIIKHVIEPRLDEIKERGGKDAKSLVQEHAQSEYKLTPTYKILDESGPAHQREFKVGLFFDDTLKAQGVGKSKQEAETKAAENFLGER
ncbi:MAG: Ribonuclease 3 [Parcubacteria group bacterium GW2011_GWB1_45_7]|nr:MAG: Ribonuclease 3 [Parcubacteria group bacterium GW2011_GWB1_45_7]